MPIGCPLPVRAIPQDAFHRIDEKVMGIVFAVHNDLGSLCDERIYQAEIAHHCASCGLESVDTAVPITASFRSFAKRYEADLLVNCSALYELKTARSLTGPHRTQTLHYLLLLGLRHGKLVNLRPGSVDYEFVSTTLTPEERGRYRSEHAEWVDIDDDSARFRQLIAELLADWGAFLDTQLFYDATAHFLGGEDKVVQRIEVVSGSRLVGTQRAHLLNPRTAFKISAITEDTASYESHLRRFLGHTNLTAIQWVNFDHHVITFKTLVSQNH